MIICTGLLIIFLVLAARLAWELSEAAVITMEERKAQKPEPIGISWWEAERIARRVSRADKKRREVRWQYIRNRAD